MRQVTADETRPQTRVALEHHERAIAQQFNVERPEYIEADRHRVWIIRRRLAGHGQCEQPFLEWAKGHHILDAGGIAYLGHDSAASILARTSGNAASSASDNPDMLIA